MTLRRGLSAVLNSELMRDAIWTLIVRLLMLLTGFASSVVLARVLGPEQFGLYAYAMAIATIATSIAGLGLPGLAVRELAILSARNDWVGFKSFLLGGFHAILLTGILVGLAVLALANYLFIDVNDDRFIAFAVSLLVPMGAIFQYGESVLRSQSKTLQSQIPELLIRRIGLLIIVFTAVVFFPNNRLIASDVIVSLIVLTMFCLLYFFYYISRANLPIFGIKNAKFAFLDQAKNSFPFLATSLVFVANDQVGVIAIQSLSNLSNVGLYRVAFRAAEVLVLVRSVADLVLQPKFAALHSQGKRAELQYLLKRSSRLMAASVVFLSAIFIIFRIELLGLYGPVYVAADQALVILVFGQALVVAMGPVVSLLSMLGYQVIVLYSALFGALLNFCLCYLLIPIFGIQGAALSSVISLVFWNLSLLIYSKYKLNYSAHFI